MKGPRIKAKDWNARWPIGTRVKYWRVSWNDPAESGETRSEAWECPTGGDPIAVVLVADAAGLPVPGAIPLTHVEPLTDPAPAETPAR